ncbi:uncharacterized protein LOC125369751 [Ricinus communis]|uniref:uncharacterized protein LOC125369751 n=1 Tax=Ricinus communis TaxID=3988 RepID=UPI00201AE548|nr:uncharacterized protein LOC125369751 [Ricinus communis]
MEQPDQEEDQTAPNYAPTIKNRVIIAISVGICTLSCGRFGGGRRGTVLEGRRGEMKFGFSGASRREENPKEKGEKIGSIYAEGYMTARPDFLTQPDYWAESCDKKSNIGFCTFLGGNLVTWKSRKQSVVARSSAKAEYRAMTSMAGELIWIKQVLQDMKIECNGSMKIYCDHQAARHITSNPVFHE